MPVPKRSRTRDVGTERPMPLEIQPMMAQSSAQPFDNPDWIFEMKWDGYRALATIDSGHVNLWSRNGLRLDSKYPPIVQELEHLKLKNAILDGEIVALDADGIPRFGLLQRFQRDRSGTLMYLVFDLLYLNGEYLIDLPLVRRRETLKKLVPKQGSIRFQRRHRRSGNRVLPCDPRTRSGGDHGETKRKPVFARAPVGKLAQNQGQNAARGSNRRRHRSRRRETLFRSFDARSLRQR